MIEMLNVARKRLNRALDAYIDVCSDIQNQVTSSTTPDGAPRLEELINSAANELLLFTSFRSKLRKARAAMSVARNCSTALVPVHALPPEILSRIFQLVVDAQNCIGKDVLTTPISYTSTGPEFPQYPDLLSLVCYRWRQIAMGSATLWSHIDIVPNHHFSGRLLLRAKGYAARAGQSLLEIHVVDRECNSRVNAVDAVQFLHSIATRIRSIEVTASDVSARFHHSVLHCCFSNCVPGTFTQLSVTQYSGPKFIETTESPVIGIGENPWFPESLLLDIPQRTFEGTLLCVSSLSLSGLYPYWTSEAYQGLVELRLFPKGKYNLPPITESHLVGILMASPLLRVLYFNLTITEPRPKEASIAPVHLDNLEVLNLGLLSHNELEIFLRWVAPGSNPLDISFEISGSSDGSTASPAWSISSPTDEVNRFLTRSSVSKLYLYGPEGNLAQVTEVLQLTPGLRVLVLAQFDDSSDITPAFKHDHDILTMTPLHLDHLYLLQCSFTPGLVQTFEQMLEKHPAQQLTLWDCCYFINNIYI